jgi:spectinomycin phosphotransferase
MLDKPDIQDTALIECLRANYALPIQQIEFLPLGADRNTAVYCAEAEGGAAYFVKLRRDDFNEMSLIVPRLLRDQGVTQIIAPIPAQNHALWVMVDAFHLTVYPFIAGKDAYEVSLADAHWVEFGQAFKGIHSAHLPPELTARIPQEQYSDKARNIVRQFQAQVETETFADPISAALADLLKEQREVIDTLVRRAEQLAGVLQTNPPPYILCHADIHAGNLLIEADGTLHVVDWDTIIRAPKERDLMFVGGALFINDRTPEQEEALFYQGYGQTEINPVALAYYRYERIVQDIAVYCEDIFLTEPGGENRAQGLRQVSYQFKPDQEIDVALRSKRFLPPEFRGL